MQLGSFIKESFGAWQDDRASRLAAGIAYYTVFSLAPLIIIILTIAGFFFGDAVAQEEIYTQIQNVIGSTGTNAIRSVLGSVERSNVSGLATILSTIILLFAASGVMMALRDALNQIWNVKPTPESGLKDLFQKRLLSFAMILTIGFLLIISLVATAATAFATTVITEHLPVLQVTLPLLDTFLSLVVIALLFTILFKYLPDANMAWSDAWVGALITALLFTAGKLVLGWYIGQRNLASAYGVAGSIIVLLFWVYYSAQIFLFGAECTKVYAKRYGTPITPSANAQYFTEPVKPPKGVSFWQRMSIISGFLWKSAKTYFFIRNAKKSIKGFFSRKK